MCDLNAVAAADTYSMSSSPSATCDACALCAAHACAECFNKARHPSPSGFASTIECVYDP